MVNGYLQQICRNVVIASCLVNIQIPNKTFEFICNYCMNTENRCLIKFFLEVFTGAVRYTLRQELAAVIQRFISVKFVQANFSLLKI